MGDQRRIGARISPRRSAQLQRRFIKRRGLELAGILTAHRPGDFQRYYNQPRNRIIDADAPPLSAARLTLADLLRSALALELLRL